MSDTLSLDRRAEKAILDGLETVLPPDRLAHYQSNVWSLSSDGGHSAKVKLGNSIFLASRFGKNFSVENQPALRQAYANAAWGGESGDTEEAFAARAKVEMQKRRDARILLDGDDGDTPEARASYEGSLRRWTSRAALAGQSAQEAFAGWQKTAQASPQWHAVGSANLWPLFEAQYGAVAEKLAPHRAALDNAFRILRGSMGVEGADESSYRGGVDDASTALQEMSAEEFRQIGVPALRVMAELAAGDDKGRLQQVLESFRRPLDNAAGASMDTLGKVQQEGASFLRPVMEFLMPNAFPSSPTGDKIGEARDAGEDKKRRMRTLLRNVADNTIDPVRVFATSTAGKTAEQALYDVAGSLGYMSTAALPGVGIPASLAGYQDQNAADLLLKHPDMRPEDAAMIGAFAAPVQTALDRLGLKVIAGKLPGFSSVMNKLAAPGGSAAFRFAAYGAGATATEYLAEKLQDAAPLAMQELASGLQADIPDADWSDYKVADWRTFWAVLPLSLLGAGVRTTSDQRKARELLQDREAMQAVGLSEEQISKITGSANPMAALQAEWKNRKVAATAEEWRERSAPLRQKIEQEGQKSATLREELNRANITISREADGRATVQTAAGVTEHATHTDALSFARAHLLANGEAESAPLLDMLEALDANPLRPVTSSETMLAPEQSVADYQRERLVILQDDTAAPEARQRAERESAAMVNRLKVYEEANPDAEIDPRKLAVGGQSELQVREGVATAVAKVALGQSPYTVLEEHTEADAEAYLQTGEATVEGLAGMIRQVEAATGDRYLNGWTEGQDAAQDRLAVKEAFSELAQVHATGKGRAGKAAGSRVAAVARADRRDAQRRVKAAVTDGTVPAGLMARLRAHVEWLKAVVGKAIRLHRARKEAGGSFDIDAFLNRSVGLEPDAAHAAGVVEQAQLIYTPPTPEEEANGIAFNLGRAVPLTDAPRTVLADGSTLIGPASFSIQAYHGTPHKVDRFSLDKIGTGEGAQAYGWGLYFAESRAVGEEYRRIDPSKHLESVAWQNLRMAGGDKVEAARQIGRGYSGVPDFRDQLLKALDSVSLESRPPSGNLYTVELLPDADEWLDWDKPLSEQSEKVKAALAELPEFPAYPEMAASEAYRKFSAPTQSSAFMGYDAQAAEFASRLLNNVGIPGIRYLDGNSRDGGTGTSNYVIFDDKLVRILEENGKPVEQPAPSSGASFRITPSATLDALSGQIAKRSRDPEARRKILDAARESLAKLKRDWSTMRQTWRGDTIRAKVEKRTPAELSKEQAMRQALRQVELESEVEQRHQGTLDAMAEGLAEFDSSVHPVLSRITTRQRVKWTDKNGKERSALHVVGDILPRSQAALSGLAEYDDAAGFPPFLFRGTRAPDQVAQELESAGIGDGSVSMPREMLRKEIDSVRAMREAVAVMSTDMKNARNQAKEELAEWRREQDEMQAEDWSGRAVLVRNLRILDALYASFPPEVRAKSGGWVQMARLKTEKAMAAELERRLMIADAHLEEVLRKDSLAEIQALFRKARPDRRPGEKPRGKLGAAVHRFFDEAERVAAMTPDELEVARPKPEDYERDGITPEEAANLWEREQILDQFGALNEKVDGKPFRDAAHLARALDLLEDVYATGRNRWRTIEEARLAEVSRKAGALVEHWGRGGEGALQEQSERATYLRKRLADGLTWDMYSGSQIFDDLLGQDHPQAIEWKQKLRDGTNATLDSQRALNSRWKDVMVRAFGGYGVKAQKALWKMATKNVVEMTITPTASEAIEVPIDSIPQMAALGYSKAEIAAAEAAFEALPADSQMEHVTIRRDKSGAPELVKYTEAQAIAITMLHGQEQYRENLQRVGWTDEAVAELEDSISVPGKMLRDFMAGEYENGYTPINEVYERMFGVALPQIKGYSPASFWHTGQDRATGPEGDIQNAGFRATALKSRTRHRAEPQAKNAFALFFGHHAQMSHWRNNAEFARELRAVFGRPEVKKALVSKYGEGALRAVMDRIKSIEGNGIMQAYGEMDAVLGMVAKWKAYTALAWNFGTAMVQATAATGTALLMSPGAYITGLGRTLTGQNWRTIRQMWNSETIRRRMEAAWGREVTTSLGQTVAAAKFLQGPGYAMEFAAKGMDFLGNVDAAFTSIGAAIQFDHAKREAMRQGLSEDAALRYAEEETSRVVFETAQPQTAAQKSNFELRQAGLAKVAYMFMSDARKNTAHFMKLMIGASDRNRTKALLIWPILGVLSQAIRNVWQDMRDDDDDEVFDERNWTRKEFLFAALLGPVNGIPILGESLNKMASGYGSRGIADPAVQAVQKVHDLMTTTKEEEREKEKIEATTRDALAVLKGLNISLSVPANVADQLFRTVDNLFDDPEESKAKEDAKKRREKREAKQ